MQQQKTGRTFSRFLLVNVFIFGFSFIIAYIGASYLLASIGPIINPLVSLLPAPANNPFWVLYILVYVLMSILILGVRYKTGSRI